MSLEMARYVSVLLLPAFMFLHRPTLLSFQILCIVQSLSVLRCQYNKTLHQKNRNQMQDLTRINTLMSKHSQLQMPKIKTNL